MRALILGAALSVTIAMTGCADKSDPVAIDDEPSTTTEVTTTEATTGCAADDADADELGALAVEAVPDGYDLQPDDVGDTGPSDLAKAASDDGGADAEKALTDLRFRRGYQWLWTSAANEQIVSFVYEFCDGDGAAGYLERGQDLLASDPRSASVEVLEVPELEGEVAFAGEVDGTATTAIDMIEGAYYLRVLAYADAGALPLDELNARASAVMVAQLREL